MKLAMAKEFLQCVGSDVKTAADTYLLCSCPLAEWRHQSGTDNHPSFRVSLGSKKSWGRCYSCNWRGPLGDLLMELSTRGATNVDYAGGFAILDKEWDGVSVHFDIEEIENTEELHPFPEQLLASYPKAWHCEPAQDYLANRDGGGVPLEVQQAWDLRYDSDRQRVCFPIRDHNGVFAGLHGRTIVGDDPPYMVYMYQGRSNPQLLLGEDRLDVDRPIVVAESVFDATRTYQCYRNVVTPKTASLDSRQLEAIKNWFHVICLFDPDLAGDRAVSKIMKARKGSSKITSAIHLPKGTDAGATPAETLAEILEPKLKLFGGLDPIIL